MLHLTLNVVTRSQGSCLLSTLQLLKLPLQLAFPSIHSGPLHKSGVIPFEPLYKRLQPLPVSNPKCHRLLDPKCHWSYPIHCQSTLSSTQSHFYFQWLDASLCGLWASPGPPPRALPCQVSCLNTHWDFYCCCLCPTRSAPHCACAATAALSQAAYCPHSLPSHTVQQQPASHFVVVFSSPGETPGKSLRRNQFCFAF